MSVPAALQPVHAEQIASAGIARLGVFGENGSGKTRLLSTIPPEIPTLVISADEENVDPLRGYPHIYVIKVTSWDDIEAVYRSMRSPSNPFKAIAFDTWTRIQALAINKVTGYRPRSEAEAMQFLTEGPRSPKGWDDWAKVGALSAEGMTQFLGLHMHTIFTFQVAGRKQKVGSGPDEVDKADDLPWILGPALTPVALRRAKEVLKLIGYLYVDTEVEASPNGGLNLAAVADAAPGVGASYRINPTAKEVRRLLVGRHDRYCTKGPSERVGYVVTDPTWSKLAPAWGA